MIKVKVFTSGKGPSNNAAGDDFQEMIDVVNLHSQI